MTIQDELRERAECPSKSCAGGCDDYMLRAAAHIDTLERDLATARKALITVEMANARAVAMVALLLDGWEITATMLYDEEGIEGWMWTDPDGRIYTEMGDHAEGPVLPEHIQHKAEEAARAALEPRP